MSDFAQSGLICTLQRLGPGEPPQIEEELGEISRIRPLALILPCHARDLYEPALLHICTEIARAEWLQRVVISINGAPDRDSGEIHALFSERLSTPFSILLNDRRDLQTLYAEAIGCDPKEVPMGKGMNVWAAVGLLAAEGKVKTILLQDSDVSSFEIGTLARIAYACSHPALGFAFAKMYYPRVADRLYGRASRLFVAPLLQALLRLGGRNPLLDFLLSFRYPLAGESAFSREVAASLPFAPGYGLEIALLCAVFRRLDPRRICQVDGGSRYDHRHHPVDSGLMSMCTEIARTLLSEFVLEGSHMASGIQGALPEAYRREARQAIERSRALSIFNNLSYHEVFENETVDRFSTALAGSLAQTPTAPLPPWEQIFRRDESFAGRLLAIAAEC